MKKRFFTCLLVLIVVITCIACGSGSYQGEEYQKEIDYTKEPVTITYLTIGDKPSNGRTEEVVDELNKILIKRVNAKLDIYYVSWDDYLNNYNAVLDSGKVSLDLVGTGSDWLDAWPNAISGNFLPLSKEMLQKYCPRTYTNVTSAEWDKCSYNGNIYMIPENEYTQWINHGFIYRKDIAQEAGIGKISSWEDLDKYFKHVKKNYTGMIVWDGDGKTTIHTLGYLMSKQKYAPIYELSTYGIWGAYYDDMKTIVSPYYTGDEFVEFARLMKSWKELGIWRRNFKSVEDNTEEFYNGYTSVVQHHTQKYFTEIKPTMNVMKPEAETDFFWFGEENNNLIKNSILHGAMAVYKDSKNPERALMVYDIIRNDQKCYNLMRYGIEGVQYRINKNGTLDKPSGYNSERDSVVLNYWWGRRDEFEYKDSSYAWDDYYELIDTYDRNAYEYPWDSVPFSTEEINLEMEPIIKVFDKYLPAISYGQYDITPEEEVALFRQELKEAGIEKMTRKLQMILDSY